MKRISKITVLIPALNEENNIQDVIKELKTIGFSDILVIDGNSNDNTASVCKKLGANVIFQDKVGKGDALRKAFNHDELGDFVVMLDADGSMNPKEIDSFLDAFKTGADVVKGSRFISPAYSEDLNFSRRIGNMIMVKIVNLIWDANFSDLCYGFAAFKKSAIEKMHPHLKSEHFEIEAEIFIKAKKMGFKIHEVPSVELRRKSGKSNLKMFTDGFKILRTIFSEVFRN
jgi:glycosyltransferase involved in cell wall biosynthesis